MKLELFPDKKIPYICTPLTGKTKLEIFEQLDTVVLQKPDMIEWRADFFNDLANVELVLNIVHRIKEKTNLPLLFTIRSVHEGGEEITISEQEKTHLLSEVCLKTDVDLIDYETSNKKQYIQEIHSVSKTNDIKLILSYHNFTSTPKNEELIELAKKAQSSGAHIAKIAVMPKTQEDVLRLLEVTKIIDNLLDIPVVTMAMERIGGLSRIIGWAYGSIITFGVGANLSAPGQLPVKKLRKAIQTTQELVGDWE